MAGLPMRVLSLGWGVQSFTLAAMAAVGELAPIEAAIHADTTHERSATYAFATRWTPWLEERGVRVVTVVSDQAQPVKMVTSQWTDIPAFTLSKHPVAVYDSDYDPDYDDKDRRIVVGKQDVESAGQLRRQCTGSWKIAGIRKWLQANRNGKSVTQLLGISKDEFHRAKDSDVKYITHTWPLIDLGMTRNDCTNWLERHGLEVPGKSACVFCPYHNKRAWQEMKRENGDDWAKAIAVDEAIRKCRPPHDLFVHSARIPLVDLDLSTPEDHGQLPIWQQTCEEGYCWA